MSKQQTFSELLKSPKSWKIDFSYDNGKSLCNCLACDSDFLGHRRRKLCYQCADHSEEQESKVNSDITT